MRSSYHGKDGKMNPHTLLGSTGIHKKDKKISKKSRNGIKGHSKGVGVNFWDFPKGLLDKGEKGIDAAKREAKEEAGIIRFKLVDGFKETARYFVRHDWDKTKKAKLKFAAMFLAKAATSKVKLSWEHDKYEWLPYEKARERITKPELKKALEKAEKFLKEHNQV